MPICTLVLRLRHQLYEPKVQLGGTRNREILHEHLRRLSKSAALHSKSVILLVHEDLGDDCLEDVCAFINQGTCTPDRTAVATVRAVPVDTCTPKCVLMLLLCEQSLCI